jgi:Na+/H+ antiporter NhaD/arsenite permease-like protein
MPTLAWISLAALVLVVILSCTTSVNPGIISLALAWVIAIWIAPFWGVKLSTTDVMAGFPTDLFLTLVGVMLFFTMARSNGSLDQLVRTAVRACRGNAGLIPIAFFGIALGVASIGAGNIAAAALVAPLAMAVAGRARIPPFLMTLMVAHGSIAGALSPIAPTGIIANRIMAGMGMSGLERQNFLFNLVANAIVAGTGYLVFGGWRLFLPGHRDSLPEGDSSAPTAEITRGHLITLAAIGLLVAGAVGLRIHVGLGALTLAVVLAVLKIADERAAVHAIPWSVILMVCGVTVLTSILERTGGIDLFTSLVARVATHRTAPGLMALVTGLVSVYSSTSGVVLPAFLPSVPGLVAKLGGGDPVAIASSILIGGHLVDVSPLSTVGAFCIASAPISADRRLLFNQVLAWGLSMSVVAALGCYFAFGRW